MYSGTKTEVKTHPHETYLLHNVHLGKVGNNPIWFQHKGLGYSSHVTRAQQFTKADADEMVLHGGGKYVAYRLSHVLCCSYRVADIQSLSQMAALETTNPEPGTKL